LLSSIEGLGSEGGTGNGESGFGEENGPGWEFHLSAKIALLRNFVSEAETVDWGQSFGNGDDMFGNKAVALVLVLFG
jgi:hypothetical protein